jgi:hypothetical protein
MSRCRECILAAGESNRKVVKFVMSFVKWFDFLVAYRVSDGEIFVMHVFYSFPLWQP